MPQHPRRQHGEVYTPEWLVEKILNQIDLSFKEKHRKSIFEKKSLKWFEPSCGEGVFVKAIFDRLMKSLKPKFPKKGKRKKHILKNMLYMSEMNEESSEKTRSLFNSKHTNIYTGNTLSLDTRETFGVDEFDVVIGNPPFSSEGVSSIWATFVKRSIGSWLKKGGILSFIHPAGWRKPTDEKGNFVGLYNLMAKEKAMVFLEMNNAITGRKVFECGTRFDWYVIFNEEKKKGQVTKVIDQDEFEHSIDLSRWEWLPNSHFADVEGILKKKEEPHCEILSSSIHNALCDTLKTKESSTHCYPLVEETSKMRTLIYYTNKKPPHLGVRKIIFGVKIALGDPIIDMEGEFGLTARAMAIKIETKEEGKLIYKALQTAQWAKIIRCCTWGNYHVDWKLFLFLKRDFYKEILKQERSWENNYGRTIILRPLKKIKGEEEEEEEE